MAGFEVCNIKDGFGAEVIGFDPHAEPNAETRATLRGLFDDRGVLVFRDIDLSYAEQDRLCRLLIGDDAPVPAVDRGPFLVSNKEENGFAPYGRLMFHADAMWAPEPFQVLSLYGVEVSTGSASTLLASGTRAWETLPEDLRACIEGREALQSREHVYSRGGDDVLRSHNEINVITSKPIVLPHPRTGEPILYVSEQNTSGVAGMEEDEAEALLQTLFHHIYAEDNVYEHEWRNGDLIVFDNFAMQHSRRNVDAHGPPRTLRKVIAPIPAIAVAKPTFDKVA